MLVEDDRKVINADIIKMFGSPVKQAILLQVMPEGGANMSFLSGKLEMSTSALSHQVRELSDAGLVTRSKKGRTTMVEVNSNCRPTLAILVALLESDTKNA